MDELTGAIEIIKINRPNLFRHLVGLIVEIARLLRS